MILAVSHEKDDHLAPVLTELGRIGTEVVVVDTAWFPTQAAMSAAYDVDGAGWELRLPGGGQVNLAGCSAGWWRRPQPAAPDLRIGDPAQAAWAANECYEALSGFWDALPLTWVSPPRATEAAMMKSWQLAIARCVGLAIPRTLITNDPDQARRFIDELGIGRTICKAFSATEDNWRETRLVRSEELALLDRVALAPVIFQEFVPAEVDLRVTIVGDEVFPAAVYSQELAYPLDFRVQLDDVRMQPTSLPSAVESALRRLLTQLRLRYGAIDMRRTPDGRYVFLEVNPAGQWLFVEETTGQPMTAAMARLLTDLDVPAGAANG